MKDLLEANLKRSLRYIESLPNRNVVPLPEEIERLKMRAMDIVPANNSIQVVVHLVC